ncbi:MAG: DUF1308 domain-containing protein [Anaerolineaceae bacterium]|nr:DUF1308 domain-containing protein [Anaerolineaceae bacterium]
MRFPRSWDQANRLLYLRARYYAPGLGVFTALDPFEGTYLNTMSVNRYGYVWGNPVNRADASGLCPQMTLDQTRAAVKTLQATIPAFMSVDGATADVVAGIVCAAQDFGQYTPQIVVVGGTTLEIAATVVGTGAAATAAVVLGIASISYLLGVGIFLGLLYPPIPYTPDQLEDMRPPTPPPSDPNVTPMPQPQPQTTPAPQPELQPLPVPTEVCAPTATSTPVPSVNLDTGTMTGLVAYNPNNPGQTAAVRAEIISLIAGRQMVATNTALQEFLVGLNSNAGPTETIYSTALLTQVSVVLDNPSARFAALKPTASLGVNDIIILGTGDQLRIPTLTGNTRALNYIRSQGILDFNGIPHSPARFREKFV